MTNKNVESATDSLDWLTGEGFFGKTSKDLLEHRSSVSPTNFYYEVIASIYADIGDKSSLNQFALAFMNLFTEGLSVEAQETIDLLTALMVGDKNNLGIETISSYAQYVESMQSYKNEVFSAQSKMKLGQSIPVATKISLAKQLVRVFDEGFEYDMKIMAFMLAIKQMVLKKKYDILKNLAQPSARKIKLFKDLDPFHQYALLTDGWDTIVRNADSHVNLRYDARNNVYLGKNQYKQRVEQGGQLVIENFTITPELILTNLLPRVTNFLQGYLVAAYMLLLSKSDQTLYAQAAKFLE